MGVMKNIHGVADQIGADQQSRMALLKVVSKLNHTHRAHLIQCYTDPEIIDIYNGMRQELKLSPSSKSKVHRLIVKFPSQIVYTFLNSLFVPQYGEDWLTNKRVLKKVIFNEELIKPWVVGTI